MKTTEHIKNKIFVKDRLRQQILEWRKEGKQIVFTNGCFDLVHYGHICYLSQAADLGNILIVGLNSDTSVQRLKGPSRPVNIELTRAMVLASMEFVDAVVVFDEETPFDLIHMVQPDTLVKGGDYTVENVVGHDIVLKNGGRVIILPFVDGFSTSALVEKINTKS